MKYVALCLTIIGLAVLVTSCGKVLDVLGPRDKPEIVSEQWNQIDVTYWVFIKENPEQAIARTFTIEDPGLIDQLKTKLRVKKTDGLSIGTGNQLVLRGVNEDLWHGDIVFEDTIYMSLSSDGWRSYRFTLEDSRFYNELRDICALNERRFHPNATRDHVQLRSNLSVEYPKL